MKAAVLHQYGTHPQYEDYPDPVPQDEGQVIVTVKAASIKQLDKLKASGRHYTSYHQLPAVVGVDGVAQLADGRKVYGGGITGMMAERALLSKAGWVLIPDGIDDAVAAAFPNALMGADTALVYRARMKAGATVLVNGATGVTGRMAVQLAKLRGAKRIIATGRNAESLAELNTLGADLTISINLPEAEFIEQVKAIHKETPIDIVMDYLWGKPMEMLLEAMKGAQKSVRIVTIGEMAGADITLPSGILRSTDFELLGAGLGSTSMEEIGQYMHTVLPEMFQHLAQGKIKLAIETVALKDIEKAWGQPVDSGKRLVVVI
jgi:NADPH:quinone reductase-like Zn-dependent oxidoreductase